MLKKRSRWFFLVVICFLTAAGNLQAENKQVRKTDKINGLPAGTKLNINNISTWIYDNGSSDIDPLLKSGFTFPRGSGKTVIFESGLVWGAKVNGQTRIGGSTYNQGLRPGKIVSPGHPADPNAAASRIYRVRPDYKTALLSNEVEDEKLGSDEIRKQYEKDWMEWPAHDGAPFNDVDKDGQYNPNIDIPGVPGASQTIWFVANDLDTSLTQALYGSTPMGIEMQATIWAYNKPGELSNVFFRKYVIVNKSSTPFTDMYISMWSDPDIGYGYDDFAGCDTTLNMGFCYNGGRIDAAYSAYPPAAGFDLLQGPTVSSISSDSAIFNGRIIKGKKNLPMTAFYYFINSNDSLKDPELGSYEKGTLQFYNLLQGKLGPTGRYYQVPAQLGGGFTKFPLSGDPVKYTGYLDGISFPAGDRRIGLSSGPFTMAVNDTQEVVIAEIAAWDYSSTGNSVSLLKSYDAKVQKLYENFFSPSVVPPALVKTASPNVKVAYNKEGITISWDKDSLIENFDQEGFKFQGYNVYQMDQTSYPYNYTRIATFDIADGITTIMGQGTDPSTGKPAVVKQQFGTDSGIKRSFTINRDSLMHLPFIPGKYYAFGVSAYTYRPDNVFYITNTESYMGTAYTKFNDTIPGIKYNDTLHVSRISGKGEGYIKPIIVDPTKLTGHDYQVGFEIISDSLKWYLKDITIDKTILSNQKISTDETIPFISPVIEGMQILVSDVNSGMKAYSVPAGKRNWSWAYGQGFDLEGFEGAIGMAYNKWFSSSTVKPDKLSNVIIKYASTDSLGNLKSPNDPNASFAYRYLRRASYSTAKPDFEQYIKNKASGYPFQDYVKNFPFAAYKEETGERLMTGYLENNVEGGTVDGKYWPPSSTSYVDNFSSNGPREWFLIFDRPYSESPDTSLQTDILANTVPIMWFGTVTRKDNAPFDSQDQFLIIKNNPFTAEDKFSFRTSYQTLVENNTAPNEYKLMQNYPNPFNPVTVISYSLKERSNVELKVFDILGREVTTLINKEQSAGLYKVQFNASSLPSGIYIYSIQAGQFRDSKKLMLLK